MRKKFKNLLLGFFLMGLFVPLVLTAQAKNKHLLAYATDTKVKTAPKSGFDFEINPNPATTNKIQVKLDGVKNLPVEITVYNMIGNKVLKRSLSTNTQHLSYNIIPEKSLRAGLYFLHIQAGDKTVIKRVHLLAN